MLGQGAHAQQLAPGPVARTAEVQLGRLGRKWRLPAVSAKTRNWCIEGSVPRPQRESAGASALLLGWPAAF